MLHTFQRVLCLGAHLDDIEFGCGAVLSELLNHQQVQIRLLTLSKHTKSSEGNIQIQRDLEEAYHAASELGIRREDIFIENLDGQLFQEQRQKIREILLVWKQKYDPDLLFFPCRQDLHQDHNALSEEVIRIYRDRTCLGYEIVRSSLVFNPNLFVAIQDISLQRKVKAVMSYRSQLDPTISAAYYFDPEIIRSIAIHRGAQIGFKFAEAFELYHMALTLQH